MICMLIVMIIYILVTVFKVQSATLDKVVYNFGKSELQCGADFVALSRVRRLQDLAIENEITIERLNDHAESLLTERIDEEDRLIQLSQICE